MTTSDPIASPVADDAGRRRRVPGWAFVAAVAIAVGGLAFALTAGTDSEEPPGAAPAPRFVDDTPVSGVDHAYTGDFDYFVGGGVAAFDCNDDARPDLYFAGGSSPAALYRNTTPVGGPLQFEKVPSTVADLTAVTGAYPIDVDSDGHLDLVVLRHGENRILRGLGDCRFEPANDALGIDGGDAWTTAFSASWEGDAELPTMAFGTYLEADLTTCGDSLLARPDGAAYGSSDPAVARLLHAVDAVQRLEPNRSA